MTNTKEQELRALADAYLAAFEARDIDRCLGFFADEASIDFQSGLYEGREGVRQWHQDRFDANLRVARIESVTTSGDTIVVDVVVTSDRLAAWKIQGLSGRITMRLENGLIRHAKLTPRMMNPVDLIRSNL
jgi:ketosteroid isomerase-like protein